MSDERHGNPHTSGAVDPVGQGGTSKEFQNPGLPPHTPRITDVDPKAEKRASRQVFVLFLISILGTILFFFGYFGVGHTGIEIGTKLRLQNTLIGLGTAFAMLGIGLGIIHWAKSLMPDHEVIEERHELAPEAGRAEAQQMMEEIIEESGMSRRKVLTGTLIGAAAIAPLPAIFMFRDLDRSKKTANQMVDQLRHTMWHEGVRLVRDPSGLPIKASDIQIGSAVHVIPEGLNELKENKLNEKAKAVVLVMRLSEEKMHISPGREDWHVNGIVAYSKICTHVGCPIALYEQHTHHLLCPCHQSTFDLTQECKVVFGPASHALPQLPITVDDEGFLVARSDFQEPVGPSYWERG
ncbi:ubiquinol-cytochrome c reductase iron-sulfur subunit [Pseudoglutamicibacter cumminsii]|uniref:cytochrome bc1 complex Rieske iron-sulfur subunit n=1 Tax=Pseudoglutamicibacter cumminsii TaxID=156979 RepID=UPI0019595490|nr:Rieske 2Fe-2S domain-containing protein [Pseudoglutamicibacter cumminsii]MBM7796761.1 ubiquinol-cytochrome c reductase iron-sulfur subunit [Pseudoglutamicibacter cumminsii]